MADKYLTPDERRKMNTFNRSNGRNKQMRAKEMLGVPERKFGGKSSDEEHWNSEVRFEVKSGNQVEPIATRFLKQKNNRLIMQANKKMVV